MSVLLANADTTVIRNFSGHAGYKSRNTKRRGNPSPENRALLTRDSLTSFGYPFDVAPRGSESVPSPAHDPSFACRSTRPTLLKRFAFWPVKGPPREDTEFVEI
jgi:hypothetical protein